jgi:hypothetical protein
MDVERLEWPCQMQTTQSFDGHIDRLSAVRPRFNGFPETTA